MDATLYKRSWWIDVWVLEVPDNNEITVKEEFLWRLLDLKNLSFPVAAKKTWCCQPLLRFYLWKVVNVPLWPAWLIVVFIIFLPLFFWCQAYSCCLKGNSHIKANIFYCFFVIRAMNLAFPMPIISAPDLYIDYSTKGPSTFEECKRNDYREAIALNQSKTGLLCLCRSSGAVNVNFTRFCQVEL